MTHSYGLRRKTRYKHARPDKGHGMPGLSTYMTTFERGQTVNIMTNGAIHKGMPAGCYHGKTGRVFNVTINGVGVEIRKRVRHRQMLKRISVRREHLIPFTGRKEYEERRALALAKKRECEAKGIPYTGYPKRQPSGPRGPSIVTNPTIIEMAALPFTEDF